VQVAAGVHVPQRVVAEEPAEDHQRGACDQRAFQPAAGTGGRPTAREPDVDQTLRGDRHEAEAAERQPADHERAAVPVPQRHPRRADPGQHDHLGRGRPGQQPAERQVRPPGHQERTHQPVRRDDGERLQHAVAQVRLQVRQRDDGDHPAGGAKHGDEERGERPARRAAIAGRGGKGEHGHAADHAAARAAGATVRVPRGTGDPPAAAGQRSLSAGPARSRQ
jgi:hypothetical protein